MTYENLKLERDGQIALVTLNRPEKLNAISHDLHLEMMEACHELQNDDDIRAVIWTGEGRGAETHDEQARALEEVPARSRPVPPLQHVFDLFGNVREGRHATTSPRDAEPSAAIVRAARLMAAWMR